MIDKELQAYVIKLRTSFGTEREESQYVVIAKTFMEAILMIQLGKDEEIMEAYAMDCPLLIHPVDKKNASSNSKL